jgi:hypothetical protein
LSPTLDCDRVQHSDALNCIVPQLLYCRLGSSGKVTLEPATKAQRAVEVSLYIFFNLGAR